ncbi:butyrophilin subfamily 2 member A2-like isoform X1 [Simochromis diagramma]|uniref:butyrophilin subfamily 2 member A2-like isoform X1 n=2 Tax=Simochromis diagramma TaxID=43689 RepID=UPI001A7E5C8F|nr:butyrophilin subfamily 2 member A2-like isoform X1 [Simochromis diagramma]
MLHSSGPGVTVVVSEESDVILPCSLSTNQNLEQKLFDWRKKAPNKQEVFMYDGGLHYNNGRRGQDEHFRGRVSHFPQELQFGNASIIIRNTTVADSGVYTCDFPHLQPEQRFCIKLVVELTLKDRSGEIPGAAPKPFVGILNISEDEALLKCEVRGASPKPKVEWRDSDGNILPAEEPQVSRTGERYDITLLTTVTRTNSSLFHCVATQEEMGHVTRDQIDVRYCEKTSEVKSHCGVGVLIGLWFSGVLTVAATLAPSVAAKCIRKHKKASQRNQRDDPSKEACNGDASLTNCLTSQL